MYFELPFDNEVNISGGEYAIATYYAFGMFGEDALKKAGKFAVGQSIGTWVPLPGITEEMVQNYQARVLGLYAAPGDGGMAVLRVAFPMRNFAGSFAMMLAAMVGNDVSTALKIKLADLDFTEAALRLYAGPKQSVEGFRRITGVQGRPLVLNMIKPCLGYSPEHGAALFKASALGGVDLIKDDELFGSIDVSSAAARVRAYGKAAKEAAQYTGKETVYIPNVTDKPSCMREHCKAVLEEGAKAAMVNFATTGIDALMELTAEFGERLCFLAHYAGAGMLDSPELGITGRVLLGSLARLAGADSVMTMCPAGSPALVLDGMQTVQKQRLPLKGIRPIMTALGGGITPMSMAGLYNAFGKDTILGAGGAVQGHPMGATAGAAAVMKALEAAVAGVGLADAANESPELAAALLAWDA